MALRDLQSALDEGRVADLRPILIGLDAEERTLLRAEVGDESYERIFAAAGRGVRRSKRGRVILLHGIMGADLDVRRGRDRDRVWIHYFRLFNGRLKDMRLTLDGAQADPKAEVIVRGQNKKYYLPPLLELDSSWHAAPFAYDWRLDIRDSADRLAELVRTFGQGEPVHLVAHSMGGLVSRAFVLRHAELWARCADPDDLKRGGRLLMLGTPNHGSYTIPLVFTGDESKVKALALIDRKHSKRDVLKIVNTFPGSYQMLPSPFEPSDDERAKLYDVATWGSLPVHVRHLEDARRFHESLRPVVDRERFVYVAGTDQKTPAAVEVRKPGELRYRYTSAGDGRVTHALGLLPGVRTYYVNQAHGDLPIDDCILGSIHELLETGETSRLGTDPGARRGESHAFVEPDEEVPDELEELAKKDAGRATGRTRLSEVEQRRVEALLLDDSPRTRGVRTEKPAARKERAEKKAAASLRIDVTWGDVTKVRADVYAVGHYAGVLPQYAERALDVALSGTEDAEGQVLRQHTLRGQLRGALGDVDLFPWTRGRSSRCVAVAGMGPPGSFTPEALRFLVRKLVWVVSNQPGADSVASVLIGSGEGTLSVRESVRAYLRGIRDAVEAGDVGGGSFRLSLVELFRHRAESIVRELEAARKEGLLDGLAKVSLGRTVRKVAGGRMRDWDAFQTLGRIVEEDSARGAARKHFEGLLRAAKRREPDLSDALDEALEPADEKKERGSRSRRRGADKRPEPIRMSFTRDDGGVRVAAISSTTTVAERLLRFDGSLLEELVEEIGTAEEASVERFSTFLTRLLLPTELREWLATESGPFVFEVDREMARVHWEMLESDFAGGDGRKPLALRAAVARQIRTTYSGAPAAAPKRSGPLRVLVVGDPGDPDVGDDLPGARDEALAVADFLEGLDGVEVVRRIGSPHARRAGRLRGTEPARRLDALKELVTGDYDVLHYCGHGDFDPDEGDRAGWVFTEGLLTSREIERVESPPALVVANACLSGRTSRAKGSLEARRTESKLLPSLADEFFRRGVRNYVGTAWTVSDLGAVLFAETFYGTLLSRPAKNDAPLPTIGDAVRAAREALSGRREEFGGLWSAYQHYGDPNTIVQR